MTRRNRKKLHHAQRLAAEERKRTRAHRRHQRQHQQHVRTAAAEAILRRTVAQSPPGDPAWATIENLLQLAALPAPTVKRVRILYEVVREPIPSLARFQQLPFLLLVARQPWVRRATRWQPPPRTGWRGRRRHLVSWLLTRWPVPAFLLNALEVDESPLARVPEEDEWVFQLVSLLGRGKSLHEARRAGVLPAPLTKAMQHRFLHAPARHSPIRALRRAQVTGAGGPAALADRLLETRLGSLQGPRDEPFWHDVLLWLGRNPEGPMSWSSVRLGRFVDGVAGLHLDHRAGGPPVVLRKRQPHHLWPAIEGWEARMDAARDANQFPPDGLQEAVFEVGRERWEVRRLRDPRDLVAEGQAMRHCVASYQHLARRGRVSLWSVRRDSQRQLTVEVVPARGRVVQIKGSRNADPTPNQADVVARWAQAQGLDLAC